MGKASLPQPVIQFKPDSDVVVLRERYEIEFHVGKIRYNLISAPGATSDGMSKPFWVIPLLGSKLNAREMPGAWTHDQLYEMEALPRKDCDKAFYYLERLNGVGWWRARMFYYRGVRVGGGIFWEKHTTKSITQARKLNNLYRFEHGIWIDVHMPERNVNN